MQFRFRDPGWPRFGLRDDEPRDEQAGDEGHQETCEDFAVPIDGSIIVFVRIVTHWELLDRGRGVLGLSTTGNVIAEIIISRQIQLPRRSW